MISLLAKLLIKDRHNTDSPEVRSRYGVLCGGVGIFLNLLLFALKLFVGTLTGSVAVTADAFNNISDAGSSVVTIFGFRLASKKPDPDHPFGHGRIEYISGLIVAMLIFVMGFELLTSAIDAILNPTLPELSTVSLIILIVSIAVKLYMYFYNNACGKRFDSATMKATAADSLGDVMATTAVVVSLLVAHYFELMIDGYVGLAVAGFILISGFRAAKETIEPLLGQRPDKELVDELEKTVLSHPPITGVHDLILHDYGPGRKFLSLHAEVPMDEDILFVHDVVDNVEFEIRDRFGIEAVIHMDPIDTRNPLLVEIKSQVSTLLSELGEDMRAHDFRIVPGPTHTNIVFDIVIPADSELDTDSLKLAVGTAIATLNPQYRTVIHIDRDYA